MILSKWIGSGVGVSLLVNRNTWICEFEFELTLTFAKSDLKWLEWPPGVGLCTCVQNSGRFFMYLIWDLTSLTFTESWSSLNPIPLWGYTRMTNLAKIRSFSCTVFDLWPPWHWPLPTLTPQWHSWGQDRHTRKHEKFGQATHEKFWRRSGHFHVFFTTVTSTFAKSDPSVALLACLGSGYTCMRN
jgi:hypothetical protein